MRRKSERNKAKGSPEKKVEKATRKSTRRRTKKSPSPDRDSGEVVSKDSPANESDEESVMESQNVEVASINEDKEMKQQVTSTEADTLTLSPEEEDNNGSVWKVARADASPGEIQKLKLCRQRNISDASSDNSVGKKKSSKWQERGEGFAEEDDSQDEPLEPSKRVSDGESPDDPSSTHPGQDSNEEVSDYKETLPEITSANLSDDKPNVDRQADAHETSPNDETVDTTETKPIESLEIIPASDTENTKETTTIEAQVQPEEEVTSEQQQDEEKPPEVENNKEVENIAEEEPNVLSQKNSESSAEEANKSEHSDSSSNDENERVSQSKVRSSVRLSRRKHRDKYRESSNSDSNDSENENDDRKMESKNEEEFSQNLEECNDNDKDKTSEKDPAEDVTTHSQEKDDEDDKMNSSNNDEESMKKEELSVLDNNSQTVQVSSKVNLKRSFTKIVETKMKKENNERIIEETETADNKENCLIEAKPVPKRRRWGASLTSDATPAFSISTDSLKVLVPEAKPLSLKEVKLSKDDDDFDNRKTRDKKHSSNNIKVDTEKFRDDLRKTDSVVDNHIGKRKISIVKDSHKSPSPPPVKLIKATNILLIKNLVRPFTLNQIKELLCRTGKIVENGFWMDRIKSKCYVEYLNEDQAFETRQALHGISWPMSNPKKLQVEYASKEDMQLARETSKDQSSRKTESLMSSDAWQQDYAQEDRNNTAKVAVIREWDLGKEDGQVHLREKEREKKEHDKKRRQRSRSPNAEVNLPPPARKFKKKEDEPPPAKLLDDLFRKTKATPCIYWLPLTNEQIAVKKEMRRQHMAEHARRLEELRRAERSRDRDRRRRSPRK